MDHRRHPVTVGVLEEHVRGPGSPVCHHGEHRASVAAQQPPVVVGVHEQGVVARVPDGTFGRVPGELLCAGVPRHDATLVVHRVGGRHGDARRRRLGVSGPHRLVRYRPPRLHGNRGQIGPVEGLREEPALAVADAQPGQDAAFRHLLDALRDHVQTERRGELGEALDDRHGGDVARQVRRDRPVDLDARRGDAVEVGQRRVARAEVVDGQPDALRAQPYEARDELVEVLGERGLRDLEGQERHREPDLLDRGGDEVRERRVGELTDRDVDRDAHAFEPGRGLPVGRVGDRRPQHPFPDRVDRPGRFREGDELHRRDVSQLGVRPPEESLGAHELAVLHADDRLVDDAELAALGRDEKVRREPTTPVHHRVQLRGERHHFAGSATLRLPQCDVGVAEHRVPGSGPGRGDPDAHRHPHGSGSVDLRAAVRSDRLGDGVADARSERPRTRLVAAVAVHRELVPADARDERVGARRAQPGRNHEQYDVTPAMPERVVDAGEVVDVDDEHHAGLARRLGRGHREVERPAVGETSELVGPGDPLEVARVGGRGLGVTRDPRRPAPPADVRRDRCPGDGDHAGRAVRMEPRHRLCAHGLTCLDPPDQCQPARPVDGERPGEPGSPRSDHLGRGVPEHRLGRGVPRDDHAVADADDGVGGRRHEGCEPRRVRTGRLEPGDVDREPDRAGAASERGRHPRHTDHPVRACRCRHDEVSAARAFDGGAYARRVEHVRDLRRHHVEGRASDDVVATDPGHLLERRVDVQEPPLVVAHEPRPGHPVDEADEPGEAALLPRPSGRAGDARAERRPLPAGVAAGGRSGRGRGPTWCHVDLLGRAARCLITARTGQIIGSRSAKGKHIDAVRSGAVPVGAGRCRPSSCSDVRARGGGQ
ncbi:hypothetical protein GALL_367190 [mine drainage metagenome]|uniref:Uncharacterized protein n=1 Tax=mine drainage metagenome TaxID=410659 RepID=A0A1J5QVK9_9ZZZZ